ncbi:hypothetical protein PP568_06845 [Mycobacteroides abscessus]|uniref:Uncharacterized protein n=1 Tax=Mycobacteroides abscessus subsp. abscessus TaxID=1185650 RepID=A0AB38D344_9MYCO|nr:hypothetical protein [Mycobacteroides abscessus]MBE5419573.1 hypothetical protein [Mycobacteroides abscessus]MBE5455728.1 hypothetical protein [Mycobacteroides abscessus]MBN7555256.1 hypothetical protein [Mycobacteroides abscessus subsp. abscessus]MDM2404648.1 hypothetical protein [Mycobacteroides abscessus]MDM2414366.1 hypothetical protein [Mycobacteroides abscessus]
MDGDERDNGRLIGARVLVGITFRDGERSSSIQRHGIVIRCDDEVIEIESPDGETFTLPPAPESFSPAAPGEYRLRSTGEVITDPDYLATWTVDGRGEDPAPYLP